MRIYKILSRSKTALLWSCILLSLATLLIFPSECRNGGTNGVFLCLQVLIPSLFPFMILSSFVSISGIYQKAPKFISRSIKYIFDLPSCAFAPVILSLIGGYPVGATAIKELHREGQLTKSQSERMAMFCVSAGPGFLLTYIGSVMTRNIKLGYILLVSQICSLIILGIITRFAVNTSEYENKNNTKIQKTAESKNTLMKSIENAIKSTASMCALVIIFSAFSEVFITICGNSSSFVWLTALIEITNGVKIIADSYPNMLLAFVCGFGGLCVHFQIFVQLKEIKINKCNFYIFRILQGFLCAAITSLLLNFFPVSETVFSTIRNAETEFYTTSIGCVFLIIVCAAFIVCIRRRRI